MVEHLHFIDGLVMGWEIDKLVLDWLICDGLADLSSIGIGLAKFGLHYTLYLYWRWIGGSAQD